jgi:hypothetical protein
MPFGLSDVPTAFGDMVVQKMWDLIITELMELFVDDGGAAADEFEEMLEKLRVIFERICSVGLSLSAKKMRLFMMEALFAGSTVGPKGVSLDLKKLTTVVQWPRPAQAASLHSFLGLTSYFRDLVKNYLKIEAPLRNLLGLVKVPTGASK